MASLGAQSIAPWLNGRLISELTPEEAEENFAYQQSVGLGDGEFESEVAGIMGPFGADQIKADRTVPVLYNRDEDIFINERGETHLGFTAPQGRRTSFQTETAEGRTDTLDQDVEEVGQIFSNAGDDPRPILKKALESEEPTIFTIGSAGNTGETAAHEFRHVAFDVLRTTDNGSLDTEIKNKALRHLKSNIPRAGKEEELFDRAFDAYRSDSKNQLVTIMQDKEFKRLGKDVDLRSLPPDHRKELLEKASSSIKSRAQKFAKMEAAAEIMKGTKKLKGGGTWEEFYFKQFLARHKSAIADAKEFMNI